MAEIDLDQTTAASVATPAASTVALFNDGGVWKYKLPSGTVKTFIPSYDAVNDFGFVGDLVSTLADGSITATLSTLTCSTGPFVSTDVGKRITVPGAGASGAQLTTTIATFISATQVTLAAPAGTTVSSKIVTYGTDNTSAINSMMATVNGLTWPGAHITFPESATNAYGFPIAVTFNKQVQIEGVGGGATSDIGDYTKAGGTRLAWWGTSSGALNGAFFTFVPTVGLTAQNLKAVSMRHCWLDCRNGDQNNALMGVQLLSCFGFEFNDFFIMDALAVGMYMGVVAPGTAVPNASSLGEAKDCSRGSLSNFRVRMLDNPAGAVTSGVTTSSAVALTTSGQSLTVTANSLPASGYVWIATNLGYPVLVNYTGGGGTTTLTGCTISLADTINAPSTVNGSNVVQAVPGNGCCLMCDGDLTANANLTAIWMAPFSHGTTWGPAAVEFRNCDSFDVHQLVINGGNSTNDGAINRIRKPGVRHNGSNTNAGLASRNNGLYDSSAGAGGISAMGVNNAGALLLGAAGPNYWPEYQLANGEALPTVENGAFLDWDPNGGLMRGGAGSSPDAVTTQAVSAATLTLLTGSKVPIPPQGFQVGLALRVVLSGSCTGAAVTSAVHLRIGTTGTTADAAVATFTSPAGTVATSRFRAEMEITIRTLGAAATAIASMSIYNDTSTGLIAKAVAQLAGTMAAFNSTTAQQFFSASTTTGAAVTLSIEQCWVEVIKSANP